MLRIINTRRLSNNRGSILVFSVVLSIATIALGAAYIHHVDYLRRQISWDIASTQAHMAAHAAMIRGMILHPSSGQSFTEPYNEFFSEDDVFDVKYRYICGDLNVEKYGFGVGTNYTIEGWGKVTNLEFDHTFETSVMHNMSTLSYANWLYISDREVQSYRPIGDDTIKFWGNDVLDGKVHSNDMIAFQSDGFGDWPTFKKRVTSCSTRFNPEDADNYVNFVEGYQLGFNRFNIPITADSVRLNNYYNDPNLGVPEGSEDSMVTEIILQPNYFVVRHRHLADGSRNQTTFHPIFEYTATLQDAENNSSYEYPPNGALFINGELWLTGARNQPHFNCAHPEETNNYIVRGFNDRLTIGASGDIIIAQDVMYTEFMVGPDSMPSDASAALGLISEEHILVWRHAPNYIRITAGLGALGDSTSMVEDSLANRWDARCYYNPGHIPRTGEMGTISIDGINCYGWDNEKAELLIYGCLIQRERGLVHSTYIDGERGYDDKDYKYDQRFIHSPPPHFFQMTSPDNYYQEPYIGDWGGAYD